MKNRDFLNIEEILIDKNEEDFVEVPLGDKIFKSFLVFTVVLTLIILIQFLTIGYFNHNLYKTLALDNISDSKIKAAPRGIIFDRADKILVNNEPSFNIFLFPAYLPLELGERAVFLKEIADILKVSQEDLEIKLQQKKWKFGDYLFLTQISNPEEAVLLSAKNTKALRIEPTFKRIHQEPFIFSHILGYTGLVAKGDLKRQSDLSLSDEVGRSGLEFYYDNYLRGINGKEIIIRDAKGNIYEERIIQEAKAGNNLKTFIDYELQAYFYNSLKNTLGRLGRKAGVGIALNPQNGEVMALVSIPSFDADNLVKFLKDPNHPIFNRAISGLYAPGSTIKPLVALAALKEDIIKPSDLIFSGGSIELPNPYYPDKPSVFRDWRPHGWVDLYAALARSSNVYFYEIGGGFKNQKGVGIYKLKEWWEKFNLNQKSGIDLPYEKDGVLPDPEWKEKRTGSFWRLGDTYNVSIGQGDLLVTPLALINYVAAVANGGYIYQPRIIKEIINENSGVIFKSQPRILKDLSRELKNLKDVQTGLREAVTRSYGTANTLNDLPIEVAAKTGTAQTTSNTKINAIFLGYAPYDNPTIAVLVLIEDAKEGSLNAVPVAKEIFMWYYNNRLNKNG